MPPFLRLATVHPALAHFAIGGLPLIVLGYALGLWRRSRIWTWVGDVALGVTAIFTLATAIFGLVSDATVPWPGGLEGWRRLHLGGGVLTTSLLMGLAGLRLYTRRTQRSASPSVLMIAVLAAGAAGFTGWVGGEGLVFHAGMAVRAAGDGALALPVEPRARPTDFLDAMRQVRAAWGAMSTRLAWMLVQEPRQEDFATVEVEALRLADLARFMGETERARREPDGLLASMSQTLAGDAEEVAEAARSRSLQDLAHSLGEMSGHCADCHEQARWRAPLAYTPEGPK